MRIHLISLVAQIVGVFVIFASALFFPAGTIHWAQGWLFLALFFGFSLTLFYWLSGHNPGLLNERMRVATSDQQGWDKLLFPLINLLLLFWLVVNSLDAGRWHWSLLPIWIQAAGAILLLASFYGLFLTFRENSYLSPVVRIQEERGQTVVSTGPYRYVRHPMYSSILVFVVGTSLLLGSGLGLLVGLLSILLLARRAVLEEWALLQELPGYRAYQAQVRYRLVPHLW